MSEPPPGRLFHEIKVAEMLDFRRWRDFERALKEGTVPGADLVFPDGPRWSDRALLPLLRPDGEELTLAIEEKEWIDRIRRGDTAPLPRALARRR